MRRFAATLVAEGTSDQALIPLVEFVLDEHCPYPHVTTFAHGLPTGTLEERVRHAVRLHPCDVLFVHRDADRSSVQVREQEILQAAASSAGQATPICVIPIRMTEAWLLADPGAIRRAAGNPNGTVQLKLPPIARLEAHADPKTLLFDTLACASELGPNRLRRFDRLRARRQVSGFMENVSVLRQLQSFVHMETQVQRYFEDGGRTE